MRELFDLLFRSRIPILIIGGHAIGAHGFQRNTADIDCLIVADRRDEMKAFLESRGFEETSRNENFSRYRHRSLTYPLLDVMQVDEKTWSSMWSEAVPKTMDGIPLRVPAIPHLIALKLHAIRQNPARELQDGDDILQLLRANSGVISAEDLRALFQRYQLMSLYDKVRFAL